MDPDWDKVKELGARHGLDPSALYDGIKKEIESFMNHGVFEEVPESEAAGQRLLGTTLVMKQ
eukprot:8591090-Alexandrium_andersonii.AAC.1